MLTQHEYGHVANIIMGMVQSSQQISDQIKQRLQVDLTQNPQVQQQIAQIVERAFPQQQRAQMGVQDNQYRELLYNWVNQLIAQYMQMYNQQQQQQPGFMGAQQQQQPGFMGAQQQHHPGVYHPGYGNQGLVGGGYQHYPGTSGNTDNIYRTSIPQQQTSQFQQPQQAQSPPPWAPYHASSQQTPSQTNTGGTMPNEPTPEPRQESLDLEVGVEQEITPRASDIRVGTYKVGSMSNHRFSVISLSTWRAFNTELEALKYVYRHMPLTAYQGHWAWVIEYPELVSIPMETDRFSDLRKKAQDNYVNTKDWSAALSAIGNEVPRNLWKTLNGHLVSEWNDRAMTYLRDANDISRVISINEIDEDVSLLTSSPQKVSMGNNPNFVRTVDTLASDVIQAVLTSNEFSINNRDIRRIVKSTDPNVGDILFTDGVYMTENGLTERDLGIAPKTAIDTQESIKNILNDHTILRRKRSILVTNIVSHEMRDGLFGEAPFYITTHLKNLLHGLQTSDVTKTTKGLVLDPSKGPDKNCVLVNMGWPMSPQGQSLDDGFMIPADRTLGW